MARELFVLGIIFIFAIFAVFIILKSYIDSVFEKIIKDMNGLKKLVIDLEEKHLSLESNIREDKYKKLMEWAKSDEFPYDFSKVKTGKIDANKIKAKVKKFDPEGFYTIEPMMDKFTQEVLKEKIKDDT